MTFQFKKAERHAVKLKIGVDGPSGSGKTMGALSLALGITNGGKVAVIDSENGSASLYADRFDFDTINAPGAETTTYIEMIDAAVAAGYDALVIDSLSHAWIKLLEMKDEHDRKNPKANNFASWGLFGSRWEGLMRHILDAPIHIVATMRSKQAYEQVEQDGKKKIVKLGLQPQVRDGAEYEFGLVFSVNIAHAAEATKDRTGLFAGVLVDLCDPEVHRTLRAWMQVGGEAPVEDMTYPIPGEWKGKPLIDVPDKELKAAVKYCRDKDPVKYARLIRAMVNVSAGRLLGVKPKQDGEPTDDEKVARMHKAADADVAQLDTLLAGKA